MAEKNPSCCSRATHSDGAAWSCPLPDTGVLCAAPLSHTHLPRVPLPLGWSFIHFQSGWASSPFTSILLYMSNFTP